MNKENLIVYKYLISAISILIHFISAIFACIMFLHTFSLLLGYRYFKIFHMSFQNLFLFDLNSYLALCDWHLHSFHIKNNFLLTFQNFFLYTFSPLTSQECNKKLQGLDDIILLLTFLLLYSKKGLTEYLDWSVCFYLIFL